MSSSDPSPSTTGHKRVYIDLTDDMMPSEQADRWRKPKLSSEEWEDVEYNDKLIVKATGETVFFRKLERNTEPGSSSLVRVTKTNSCDAILSHYRQDALSIVPKHQSNGNKKGA